MILSFDGYCYDVDFNDRDVNFYSHYFKNILNKVVLFKYNEISASECVFIMYLQYINNYPVNQFIYLLCAEIHKAITKLDKNYFIYLVKYDTFILYKYIKSRFNLYRDNIYANNKSFIYTFSSYCVIDGGRLSFNDINHKCIITYDPNITEYLDVKKVRDKLFKLVIPHIKAKLYPSYFKEVYQYRKINAENIELYIVLDNSIIVEDPIFEDILLSGKSKILRFNANDIYYPDAKELTYTHPQILFYEK